MQTGAVYGEQRLDGVMMRGKSEESVEQTPGRGCAEDSGVWRGEWLAFPVSLVLEPRQTGRSHLYL